MDDARSDREILLGDALALLKLDSSSDQAGEVKHRIVETAERFTSEVDAARKGAKLSDLRKAILESTAKADELERLIQLLLPRLYYAIPALNLLDGESRDFIINGIELTERLRRWARETRTIEARWPKKGGRRDLHKIVYGSAKIRLAADCYAIYLEFRGEEGATSGTSSYRDFTGKVYEIATDEEADAPSVGLSRYTDTVAAYKNKVRPLGRRIVEIERLLASSNPSPEERAGLEREKVELAEKLAELPPPYQL